MRLSVDGVVLFPNGGPSVGHLVYRERLRPLEPVMQIFCRGLAGEPDSDIDLEALHPRLLVTSEGEYAAVATVRSRSATVQHDLGVVLLDDSYAFLHAVTRDPARFAATSATVIELLAGDVHQLGVRRRRFLYGEPAAWQGRPRGLFTDYFPLDFPLQNQMLTVMPALPRPGDRGSAQYIEALLARQRDGSVIDNVQPTVAIRTATLAGHEGAWICRRSPQSHSYRIAVLEDERYLYPVLLEGASDLATAHELFAAVVESIQPIPSARLASVDKPAAPSLSMWEV